VGRQFRPSPVDGSLITPLCLYAVDKSGNYLMVDAYQFPALRYDTGRSVRDIRVQRGGTGISKEVSDVIVVADIPRLDACQLERLDQDGRPRQRERLDAGQMERLVAVDSSASWSVYRANTRRMACDVRTD